MSEALMEKKEVELKKPDDLCILRNATGIKNVSDGFEFTYDSKVYKVPYYMDKSGKLIDSNIFTREICQHGVRRAYTVADATPGSTKSPYNLVLEELPADQRRTEGFGALAVSNEELRKQNEAKDAEIERLKAQLKKPEEIAPAPETRKPGRPKGS